jgi:hypothetical protein
MLFINRIISKKKMRKIDENKNKKALRLAKLNSIDDIHSYLIIVF